MSPCAQWLARPDPVLTPLAAEVLAALSATAAGSRALLEVAQPLALRARLSDGHAARPAMVTALANMALYGDDAVRRALLLDGAGDVLAAVAASREPALVGVTALAAAALLGPGFAPAAAPAAAAAAAAPLDAALLALVCGVSKTTLDGHEYHEVRFAPWQPALVRRRSR